jgi:hypothetical protein
MQLKSRYRSLQMRTHVRNRIMLMRRSTSQTSPGVNKEQALIANAITYRQHPRDTLNTGGVTPSIPFCDCTLRNYKLSGVINT